MKKLIVTCLAAVAFVSLYACTTVEEKPATHTSTTTTEQSTVQRPVSTTSTTETQSVR
jgi:outer membrane biogenesis lipoprotein LolB